MGIRQTAQPLGVVLAALSLPALAASGPASDGPGRAFRALGLQLAGKTVSAALAFDHDSDCGIYNMGTRAALRRRGFASALIARHLSDALERGCMTASVQSTPMAEGVYARAGFRDLGRFLEFRIRGQT